MADLEQLRHRYDDVRPHLVTVCSQIENWLLTLTRELGIIEPRVTSRVKEPHSLLLKTLKREFEGRAWEDPLSQSSDKVGARVDVVYLADIDVLRTAILAERGRLFDSVEEDDKLQTALKVDRLGYRGVHFDVVPAQLPAGLPKEMAQCEIQVRTNAQAAWAMATHDLMYKAPVDPGPTLERQVNQLTSLMELFDDSIDRARCEMMGRQGYPLAIVIRSLEAVWMTFTAGQYDRELTRDVVAALTASLEPETAHDLGRSLEAFAGEHQEKLRGLYDKLGYGHPMLGQPESLLVFFHLDRDQYTLQEDWVAAELPYPILEALSVEWGVTLPAPH